MDKIVEEFNKNKKIDFIVKTIMSSIYPLKYNIILNATTEYIGCPVHPLLLGHSFETNKCPFDELYDLVFDKEETIKIDEKTVKYISKKLNSKYNINENEFNNLLYKKDKKLKSLSEAINSISKILKEKYGITYKSKKTIKIPSFENKNEEYIYTEMIFDNQVMKEDKK